MWETKSAGKKPGGHDGRARVEIAQGWGPRDPGTEGIVDCDAGQASRERDIQ
jgi:hypothetical protein